MEYCKCLDVRSVKDALRDIWDEVLEWKEEPSRDEFSDVMFGIGRFIGALLGRVYVHIPGDRLHVEKIDMRMMEYGCVRSKRAIQEGRGCA